MPVRFRTSFGRETSAYRSGRRRRRPCDFVQKRARARALPVPSPPRIAYCMRRSTGRRHSASCPLDLEFLGGPWPAKPATLHVKRTSPKRPATGRENAAVNHGGLRFRQESDCRWRDPCVGPEVTPYRHVNFSPLVARMENFSKRALRKVRNSTVLVLSKYGPGAGSSGMPGVRPRTGPCTIGDAPVGENGLSC